MGLAINTHYLADLMTNDAEGAEWMQEQLALVNEFLKSEGLSPHEEPETIGTAQKRRHVSSFPTSFLHHLRRAFARVRERQPVTPVNPDEDPAEDSCIEAAASTFDAHLLCHSDCEGYYVPVEFEEVIFDLEKRGLPGEMLGSSQRLFAEMIEVAPAIGIELRGG